MNLRRTKKAVSKLLRTHYGWNSLSYQILSQRFNGLPYKPETKTGRKEKHNKSVIATLEQYMSMQKHAFKTACINVLGEDPDDWDLSPEELEEKYKLEKS